MGIIILMGLVSFFLQVHNAASVQFVIKAPINQLENENNAQTINTKPIWSLTKMMLPAVINTWAFSNATLKGNKNTLYHVKEKKLTEKQTFELLFGNIISMGSTNKEWRICSRCC